VRKSCTAGEVMRLLMQTKVPCPNIGTVHTRRNRAPARQAV
jgi:hypothetical protein